MKKTMMIFLGFMCLLLVLTGCNAMVAIGNMVGYEMARQIPVHVDNDHSIVIAYIAGDVEYRGPIGFAPDCFVPIIYEYDNKNQTGTGTYFEVFVENVETKQEYLLFKSADIKGPYPISQFRISKGIPVGTYRFKELFWTERNEEMRRPFTNEHLTFRVEKSRDIIYLGEFAIRNMEAPVLYRISSDADKEKLRRTIIKFNDVIEREEGIEFSSKEKHIKEYWKDFFIDELHAVFYFYASYKLVDITMQKNFGWNTIVREKLDGLKEHEAYRKLEGLIEKLDLMKEQQ